MSDGWEIDWKKLLDADRRPTYVAYECRVNLADLTTVLSTHASKYAYVMACYETARNNVDRAKWKLNQLESELFKRIQEQEPGLAIGRTRERVQAHPKVADAQQDLHEAQDRVGALKSLIAGLEHRRDMLVQLSSREKVERQLYGG